MCVSDLIDAVGVDSTQHLLLVGRIDARFKEVPRCVASRPGTLDQNVRIAPQGKLLLTASKAIAVMPVSTALRTDLKVQALAEVHSSAIANQVVSGLPCAQARMRAP